MMRCDLCSCTGFYSKWRPCCIEMRIKPCKEDWEAFNQTMELAFRQPWHAIQTSPPWRYTSVCTIEFSQKKTRETCSHAVAAAKINCGYCTPHHGAMGPCAMLSCWAPKLMAMINAPFLWDDAPSASITTISEILACSCIRFLHDVFVSVLLPLVNWISWPSAFGQELCHQHGCVAPPAQVQQFNNLTRVIMYIVMRETTCLCINPILDKLGQGKPATHCEKHQRKTLVQKLGLQCHRFYPLFFKDCMYYLILIPCYTYISYCIVRKMETTRHSWRCVGTPQGWFLLRRASLLLGVNVHHAHPNS